jgi:subtilisin-like proprotein convertase family protein
MSSSSQMRWMLVAALATALIATGCKSTSSPTVTSLVVTPATGDVTAGGAAVPLTATATYSDSSTANVTSQAAWSTSATGQVDVSAAGAATAPLAAGVGGTATVTAALGGQQATTTLTVVRGPAIGIALGKDPLAPQQWYLVNTAQNGYADSNGTAGADLHLANAWRFGLTGAKVKVAIVDSGLEVKHEDLADNVEKTGNWNFLNSTADPTPTAGIDGDHGTSVAGITAMVYKNDLGGMGVAPGVKLRGYNLIANREIQTVQNQQRSLGGGTAPPGPISSDIDIFNQSFGVSSIYVADLDSAVASTYEDGITKLRAGIGAIYVKSAGNGFSYFEVGKDPAGKPIYAPCDDAVALGISCQNPNMEEVSTIPANIMVASLAASGIKASYSSAGSANWVSAPGGEDGYNQTVYGPDKDANTFAPAMVTTDRSNCTVGYSRTGVKTSTFAGGGFPNTSCNYTNTFNGTSSAAPALSGAIALLLDARPTLTWREVKYILAMTARKVDPDRAERTTDKIPGKMPGDLYVTELAWTKNRAGRWFHNWYGFGAVDVDAAVAMAEKFTPLPAFKSGAWIASTVASQGITDNDSRGVTSTITVPAGPISAIEALQIKVDVEHELASDLAIELTGPGSPGTLGTKSILLNVRNGLGALINQEFVLSSNAFFGEAPEGTWTLKVVDGRATKTGTLKGWKIKFYGR